ncbi:L,D-transpeptidase family protein [Aliikangiella sp. IMCC44632]
MKVLAFMLLFPSIAFSAVDLVKVDKSERKMYLMENGVPLIEYSISLGGSPQGHKEQEGDQKTPEGEYVLDYVKEDSSFYRAMHISYPNQTDKQHAKSKGVSPGGFIMVHGQKNGLAWLSSLTQKFDWTDGCIAITNSEMDEFLSLVNVGTKIIIEW